MTTLRVIQPNWPAPASIRAFTTTREGGVSTGAFASLNLAGHVGDEASQVAANRATLLSQLNLPSAPVWLNQAHTTHVVQAEHYDTTTEIDAAYTTQPNVICTAMTADCLPLLLCSTTGDTVAAIHAGWRGLANGIIERTLESLPVAAEALLVWLGPAIGPHAFEVGDTVRNQFLAHAAEAETGFVAMDNNQWLADIYLLARQRLASRGVTQIYGGDYCTYTDESRFFSYRRAATTGRMASMIWIAT